MKNKVLKLAKRLGKFSVEEIAPIIMAERGEIKNILADLIKENSLSQRSDGLYFYVEQKPIKKELPLFFEFHTPQEVDLIIKCFCAEIPNYKASLILGKSDDILCGFNKYFRQTVFEKQKNELLKFYEENPRITWEREFLGQIFFFYNYENKVFVSESKLQSVFQNKHSKSETAEFKRVYSFIKRYTTHNTRKYYPYFYISEAIWRRNKDFQQLKTELCDLLGV